MYIDVVYSDYLLPSIYTTHLDAREHELSRSSSESDMHRTRQEG